MEFKMTTDLAVMIPKELPFNFEELEAELTERLHHYNTMVITEDGVREGKEDLAKLRKLREAIDTRRKEVKKQYSAPLTEFEDKVKRLIVKIDEPIAVIDSQVKAFVEQEREQKLEEIRAAYEELVPESFKEIIPCDRILDPKWLNKTTTMKSIRERLSEIAKRANVDMALIEGVNPKYMAAVKAKFIETLDVSTALNYQDELMAAEERFRQQEEARAQREAQRAAWAGQVQQTEEKPPVAVQEPVREPQPQTAGEERVYLLRLEFQLTKREADELKQFLTNRRIQYKNITNK